MSSRDDSAGLGVVWFVVYRGTNATALVLDVSSAVVVGSVSSKCSSCLHMISGLPHAYIVRHDQKPISQILELQQKHHVT